VCVDDSWCVLNNFDDWVRACDDWCVPDIRLCRSIWCSHVVVGVQPSKRDDLLARMMLGVYKRQA